jgi:hypothetical protein
LNELGSDVRNMQLGGEEYCSPNGFADAALGASS